MSNDSFQNNPLSLNFLGFGQRIVLDTLVKEDGVRETINKMINEFQPPGSDPSKSPLPTNVSYNSTKQWLIGLDFTVLDLLQIGVVFEDPRLYGMLIHLYGDAAGSFKNLSLDISYEKINNTTGLYKGFLIVPDQFRRMDLETCSLTLPTVGLEIYTNGDFKVDMGFPAELDFKRSFQLEIFPYKGAGGFYFGKANAGLLNRDRLPDNLPIKTIMEFGLGLELGVGKSFNKGALKADVSVTFQGLLEGILAVCEQNNLINNENRHYWIRGIIGVAGQLHGEVDLQIIAVSVNASIQAKAEGVLQTKTPQPPLRFSVNVSASGEIRIGSGKLKRTISKKFNKSVEFDYNLGKSFNTLQLPATSLLDDCPATLCWQPVYKTSENLINLYFTPQLTIEQEANQLTDRKAKYTVMTYLDGLSNPSLTGVTSFHKLIKGLFLWTMRACLFPDNKKVTDIEVLNRKINKKQLESIYANLTGTAVSGSIITTSKTNINYNDISNFFAQYFSFEIYHLDALNEDNCNNISAFTCFPMLPELAIKVVHTPADSGVETIVYEADFSIGKPCSSDYKRKIKELIQKEKVNYRNRVELSYDSNMYQGLVLEDTACMNITCLVDYVLNLLRETTESAINLIGPNNTDMLIAELVTDKYLLSPENVAHLSGIANIILSGQRLPKPTDKAKTITKDTPVFPIYDLTCQQFKLPSIQPNDEFTITLSHIKKVLQITFKLCDNQGKSDPNTLGILLSQMDIDLINRILHTNISDAELSNAGRLPNFKEVSRKFPAKNLLKWNGYNLSLFSDSLSKKLENYSKFPLNYQLRKSYQIGEITYYKTLEANEYRYVTKVDVHIRKIKEKNTGYTHLNSEIMYEVIGANNEGKRYLEILSQSTNTTNELEIHVLLPDDQKKGQFKSSLNAQVDVIQTNLSIFSIPEAFHLDDSQNSIIKNLYSASLIRSGKCYLKYCEDGKGLPHSVFQDDKSAEGTVTFLIVHPENSPTSSYINGAVLYDLMDEKTDFLFLEDEHDKVKVPAFPPGHIGIWLERDEPQYNLEETDLTVFLRQQYQMVSCLPLPMQKDTILNNKPQAIVPISPMGKLESPTITSDNFNEEKKIWRYETIISFLEAVKTNENNIYAGIGEKIPILLELRDVFGNRLSTPSRTLNKVAYYFDNILPVHQWPGTRLDYIVSPSNCDKTINFQIRFHFNKKGYNNFKDSHVLLAKETYKTAYWQVRNAKKLSIQTSLSPDMEYNRSCSQGDIPSIQDEIVRYLGEICTLLDQEKDDSSSLPPSATITIPVNLTQSEPIFNLWLKFIIERPEKLIDPKMRDVCEVKQGISLIWPTALSGEAKNSNTIKTEQSLNELAKIMRDKYQIELALGPSVEENERQRSLWGVQWGNGANQIDVTIQPETYVFNPFLLPNVQKTFNLSIFPYSYEKPNGNSEPITIRQDNVILRKWGEKIWSFITDMLDPKYLDAVKRVNNGKELDTILCAKRKIAKAIVCSLDHVGNMNDHHINVSKVSVAKQRLEQQLLERLSDADDIDAVIQHHVSVHSPFNSTKDTKCVPRLYGSINGSAQISQSRDGLKSSNEKEYEFSNTKLPLTSGDGHLTYLFRTKTDGKIERYSFDNISYKITHLEHQIRNLPGMGTYQDSSWLNFINPIEKFTSYVELPIVLKSYPKPLTLLNHRIDYKPDSITLEEVLKYKYSFSYLSSDIIEAQDRIKVMIDWGNTEISFNPKYENLVQSLAQLIYAYEGGFDQQSQSINPSIKAHMEKLSLTPSPSGSCPIYDASRPVTIFGYYVNDLADKWLDWSKRSCKQLISNEGNYSYYTIHEHSSKKDDDLYITVQGEHPQHMDNITTCVQITGFDTVEVKESTTFKFVNKESGEYLKFDQRKATSNLERIITIDKIDILNNPKPWAGIYQTRNEGLFDGSNNGIYNSVNEKFIFRSPLVRFVNNLPPNLVTDKLIDVANLSSTLDLSKRTIKEYLTTLMDSLLMGKKLSVVGTVSYNYVLFQQQELKVPQLMTFPFKIDGSSNANLVLDELSQTLEKLLHKKDGPKKDVGAFRIELALYEPLHHKRPIVHLKGLYLELNKIQY